MRRPDSHKGENGKVAIIGGSTHQHGAPLFSALAAEAGGCDLLFVCVPACHVEIAKATSLNFQVHPFAGDDLTKADLASILELLATVDAAIIGPGIDRSAETLGVLRELIAACPCPLVLDASALQSWTLGVIKGRNWVVTPHLGELERMGIDPDTLGATAADYGTTILAKGPVDHIANVDGTVVDVSGGNAGLTVGGTGDALAGLTASLMAQGMTPADACKTASESIKAAGDTLSKTRATFTARDVVGMLPQRMPRIF